MNALRTDAPEPSRGGPHAIALASLSPEDCRAYADYLRAGGPKALGITAIRWSEMGKPSWPDENSRGSSSQAG